MTGGIDYATPLLGLDGQQTNLEPYRGHVLLVVNTASQCGFTPQYAELEALWRAHRDRGLVVLGFPCNQFGRQEPGSAEEIATFCDARFGVTFPLSARVEVNGPATHPLFAQLKEAAPGLLGTRAIKWNFTKFVVDRDGRVVARYGPRTMPRAIEPDLIRLLGASEPG